MPTLYPVPELTRRRLKDLASLHRKKHRDRAGEFLVEGLRSVESALAAGASLVEILVTEEASRDERVRALLDNASVSVHAVAARDLDRIADTATTQGIVAVARTALADADTLTGAIVALDGVQDPGNVGAILRTAAWFGADAVLAGPGTADPFGPKAVRAAMGGLWDLRIAATDDLAGALDRLRASGHPLFGADLDGEPASAWSPPHAAVLVLGSEAHGLSGDVRARLDGRVRIGAPHADADRPGVESLNVSVAAGVLLHRWLGG
ncbi:MAG: RNA methyltransferase [Rhodothermales bacterium]